VSRLDEVFAHLRRRGERALIPYFCAGDPSLETTARLIEEADVFQLFWSRNAMCSPAVEGEWPKVKRLIVRGLTEATHGNATGIGMAEFCRSRCVEKMNAKITRINCLTGGHPTAAMLPLDYATDTECLEAALPTIGLMSWFPLPVV